LFPTVSLRFGRCVAGSCGWTTGVYGCLARPETCVTNTKEMEESYELQSSANKRRLSMFNKYAMNREGSF